MKIKDLKLAVSELGSGSFIKVVNSSKYEKEYMQKNKDAKSYEIRFAPSAINKGLVQQHLKSLNLSYVHDFRVKNGFYCGSFLVEL